LARKSERETAIGTQQLVFWGREGARTNTKYSSSSLDHLAGAQEMLHPPSASQALIGTTATAQFVALPGHFAKFTCAINSCPFDVCR
jgi:hypothetical protein